MNFRKMPEWLFFSLMALWVMIPTVMFMIARTDVLLAVYVGLAMMAGLGLGGWIMWYLFKGRV